MDYWEQQELELLRKENAWLDELNPLMRTVDNTFHFLLLMFLIMPVGFGIGFLIGMML